MSELFRKENQSDGIEEFYESAFSEEGLTHEPSKEFVNLFIWNFAVKKNHWLWSWKWKWAPGPSVTDFGQGRYLVGVHFGFIHMEAWINPNET